MKIADVIVANQNPKEMFRRAIKILEKLGQDVTCEKEEFYFRYHEKVGDEE